jgi:hypothetical protein
VTAAITTTAWSTFAATARERRGARLDLGDDQIRGLALEQHAVADHDARVIGPRRPAQLAAERHHE